MRTFAIIILLLSGLCLNTTAALAQDTCKQCREFQQACLKAHSTAACKTDYDICMKHCKK